MLDKELIARFKHDTSVVGEQDLIRKSLNAKYGVDEKIIALLSSEQARKDFNNLKPKDKQKKTALQCGFNTTYLTGVHE